MPPTHRDGAFNPGRHPRSVAEIQGHDKASSID
jgi:hypothetical protein